MDISYLIAALCALSLAIGCAKPGHAFEPQPAGWTEAKWRPCPPDVPGADAATCAHILVPLDWRDPRAKNIAIFARKFTPPGPIRGQLWAFDGGPGETGDGFTTGWFRNITLALGYELIVPTHRGTAYGTALRCPNAKDLETCVQELSRYWGNGLRHFDTHMAARDVIALANAYPPPAGTTALAFGGSYGTIWLQRVLQESPTTFSAAYLDSAGAVTMNFARFGNWFERVGHVLLERCAETETCAKNFANGPKAAASQVLAMAATRTGCFATLGKTLADVQSLLSTLLQTNQRRALIAPFLARFVRCAPTDVKALKSAFRYRPEHSPESTRNGMLNLVATYRELYRQAQAPEMLEALPTQLFDNGAMLAHLAHRKHFPPNFARALDARDSGFAGTLHIVQGALDPLTPQSLVDEIVGHWKRATSDVVLLRWGGHASPRYTQRVSKKSCTEMWLAAFLSNPTAPFERSCVNDLPALDLGIETVSTKALATELFGAGSAWE